MSKHLTILLTGGRGRLANSLRISLEDAGFLVRSFSRTAGEGHNNLEEILQPGLWEDADALVHTAWSTVPLISERDPCSEWKHDFPLLIKLLRHISEHYPLKPPHFVFFSSGGTVYGDAPAGTNCSESSPLRPKGWHGFAKAQAEHLVREYCQSFSIPYTILRISNPYGMKTSNLRPQGIIPILIRCALDDDEFRLWGDGQAEKDFLYIDDFNDAIAKVLRDRITGTFNLAFGKSYTINAIIQEVEQIVGSKIRLVREPGPRWDVIFSRLDISAFIAASGWKPQITLPDGLRLLVHHFRQSERYNRDQ